MSTIRNKRCTQLIQITPAEVQGDDLLYIVDTSARESKKISVDDFGTYLSINGNIYSVHAITSDTASIAMSASWAPFPVLISVPSSSWASSSLLSFQSITASYAMNGEIGESQTASYLKYQGTPNGTASFALTSSLVINARTASFIQYTPGINNGTASYSITTQNVNRAIRADTASYFDVSIGVVSYANEAGRSTTSDYSSFSESSSYLVYSPNNGTASYAMKAKTYGGVLIDYGVYSAITQSINSANLDNVKINPSTLEIEDTSIEVIGSVLINFTSSIPVNETLVLAAKNRNTGNDIILDTLPVYYNISPIVGDWNTMASGSFKMPFTLIGQTSMSGEYLVFVSSSTETSVILDPNRISKFKISSISDDVSVTSDGPMVIYYSPTESIVSFSSSLGGPWFDSLPGLQISGSTDIIAFNASGSNIDTIKYLWTLVNLQDLDLSYNSLLRKLEGMPSSLVTMSCYSCSLDTIYSLRHIPSMSKLVISDNQLTSLPELPVTLSYLDCRRNLISSLPSVFPHGLSELYCGNNQIMEIPLGISSSTLNVLMMENNNLTTIPLGTEFPPLLYTMSFANNPSLTSIVATWPVSMSWLDISQCGMNSIFPLPESSSYISAFSSSLSESTIEDMVTDLVNYGLSNGYLDIRGTGIPNENAMVQIGTLIVRGWTVLYDS